MNRSHRTDGWGQTVPASVTKNRLIPCHSGQEQHFNNFPLKIHSALTCIEFSSFTNGITFGEQWSNLTGNPFDDTLNPDNFDLIFDAPLLVQQEGATDIFFTGIQIDNDGTGSDQDDFRIYASGNMLANTAYSVDAIATVTPALSFDNLTPGTYTDDADGGTTFLAGFSLVVSNEVIPEPSALALTLIGLLFLSTRRHR